MHFFALCQRLPFLSEQGTHELRTSDVFAYLACSGSLRTWYTALAVLLGLCVDSALGQLCSEVRRLTLSYGNLLCLVPAPPL